MSEKTLSKADELERIEILINRIVELAKEEKIRMYDYERYKNNLRVIFLEDLERKEIRKLEE